MTVLISFVAIAITTAGLVHLTFTNPKRRRTLRQEQVQVRKVGLARLAIWLPGIALAIMGEAAVFVIWLAVLTVLGWVLAAAPIWTRSWAEHGFGIVWAAVLGVFDRVKAVGLSFKQRVKLATASSAKISEISELRSRVESLEARLEFLEAQNTAGAIDQEFDHAETGAIALDPAAGKVAAE